LSQAFFCFNAIKYSGHKKGRLAGQPVFEERLEFSPQLTTETSKTRSSDENITSAILIWQHLSAIILKDARQ
jgi:hypothetical protein